MTPTADSDIKALPGVEPAGRVATLPSTRLPAHQVEGKEIARAGRLFRTARLRHEWCDFLEDPAAAVAALRRGAPVADLFTFVRDIGGSTTAELPFHRETASLAALPVTTYAAWWEGIGFKTRNKVRKGKKSGVVLRTVALDDAFALGVEAIYNECPVRQGRKFFHYGKRAPEIREELSSFLDRCILVGAYHGEELVGFMKLFQGREVLRTIHIIAKLCHRDKCVMDALIGRAVELCAERGLTHLHYGSWTDGGVGAFREKHGFGRVDLPRYYVPLTWRGRLMLALNLHRQLRERLPGWLTRVILGVRAKINAARLSKNTARAE